MGLRVVDPEKGERAVDPAVAGDRAGDLAALRPLPGRAEPTGEEREDREDRDRAGDLAAL